MVYLQLTSFRAPAPGRIDAELIAVSKRVSNILINLPRNITPVNLEELRRVKSALVELESKADNLRCARPPAPAPVPSMHQMSLHARTFSAEQRDDTCCIQQSMASTEVQALHAHEQCAGAEWGHCRACAGADITISSSVHASGTCWRS